MADLQYNLAVVENRRAEQCDRVALIHIDSIQLNSVRIRHHFPLTTISNDFSAPAWGRQCIR